MRRPGPPRRHCPRRRPGRWRWHLHGRGIQVASRRCQLPAGGASLPVPRPGLRPREPPGRPGTAGSESLPVNGLPARVNSLRLSRRRRVPDSDRDRDGDGRVRRPGLPIPVPGRIGKRGPGPGMGIQVGDFRV